MRFKLVLLAWLFAVCVGLPPSAAADSTGSTSHSGVSKVILSGVSSSTRAESFLLAPELNFLHPDKPRFHTWPIVARGDDLDSAQVVSLVSMIGRAAPGHHQGAPDHCGFSPTYGLRFRGDIVPVDMLISSDYNRWCFLKGETGEGEYCPETTAARDSLGMLIRHLFPNLGRPDERGRQ